MNFEQPILPEESEETLKYKKIAELKSKRDLLYSQPLRDVEDHGEVRYTTAKKLSLLFEKSEKLKKKIESMNLKPSDFLFWHILAGSTPDTSPDFMELDTPDGDIEKLINELTD
jgi:hypothetical protein